MWINLFIFFCLFCQCKYTHHKKSKLIDVVVSLAPNTVHFLHRQHKNLSRLGIWLQNRFFVRFSLWYFSFSTFFIESSSIEYSNGARVTDTHVRKPQEWFGSEDVKRVIPRNCANTEISNKNRLVMKFSVFLPPFSFVFIYTNMDLFCFPLSLPATSAEYLAQLVFIDTCQIYMN